MIHSSRRSRRRPDPISVEEAYPRGPGGRAATETPGTIARVTQKGSQLAVNNSFMAVGTR